MESAQIKNILRKSITQLYSLAGLKPIPRGHRVFMFHSIEEKVELDPNDFFTVPLKDFKEELIYLKEQKNTQVIKLDEDKIDWDKTNVSITFDDGYKNNMTMAAPLLIQNKMPFSIFIATGFVKNQHPDFMSEEQIKELSTNPLVTIGSHSVSHKSLTKLNDEELERELSESKAYLEELTQKSITTLAYPYGAVDRRVRDMAEKVGYKTAVCSRFDINKEGRDPLLLNRSELNSMDNPKSFAEKLRGHWDWYRYRHKDPAK